jgi:hypothetical protein
MVDVIPDAAGEMLRNIFAAPAEPGPPYTHTIDLSPPDPAEAVAWLRGQLEGDKAAAEAATPGPWAWEATGEKDSSWAVGLVQDEDGNTLCGQIEPGEGIVIDGVCEGIDGHLPDATHIALRNPADTIADCGAKLTLLDEHSLSEYGDGCRTCYGTLAYPCPTIRILAAACRHREGYDRYWGTPATHTLTEGGK